MKIKEQANKNILILVNALINIKTLKTPKLFNVIIVLINW